MASEAVVAQDGANISIEVQFAGGVGIDGEKEEEGDGGAAHR
jgi:hypothetical protein